MKTDFKNRPDLLLVRLNDVAVGNLVRLNDDTTIFTYDVEYSQNANRPILSQSLKTKTNSLAVTRHQTGPRIPPFFSNLLPEGALRNLLADKLLVNPMREFYLLAALGSDLPGAVIVEPLGEISLATEREYQLSEKQKGALMRFSLAGVQLKFSAISEQPGTFTIPANGAGGSWIVKLPSDAHPQLPEIEYAMLTLANLVGISTPEIKLVLTADVAGLPKQFGDSHEQSLAVRRFDRDANGTRIHAEDFAQVYNVHPQEKYEKAGYGHIARVLWNEAGEASFTEFIRRLVFSVAIGNGDMHLKNWSLLYSDPQKPHLSPAYDFVPTVAVMGEDNLALNLGGTKDFNSVTIEKFQKVAAQAGFSERITRRLVTDACEAFWETWNKERLSLGLPDKTRKSLDHHIKTLPLFKQK